MARRGRIEANGHGETLSFVGHHTMASHSTLAIRGQASVKIGQIEPRPSAEVPQMERTVDTVQSGQYEPRACRHCKFLQ
jgi:hypothetical protein